MTGTRRTTEGLDARRRKALYHAWHRGMREMDLLLGNFADATIGDLPETELSEFETLLDVPDPELFNWICGRETVAANYDTGLFRRIREFHNGQREDRS